MANILVEGALQRSREDVTGWVCSSCCQTMRYVVNGVCIHCKHAGTLYPIKTPERAHDETLAAKMARRTPQQQREFDHLDPMSQMGNPLTADQLLTLIRKFVPAAVSKLQFNPYLKRTLMAYYVPATKKELVVDPKADDALQFVCCSEPGIMPEWDILPEDADFNTMPQIRGWRTVLGIFYRQGIIPFLPDDGRRKSWWEIRESPIQ